MLGGHGLTLLWGALLGLLRAACLGRPLRLLRGLAGSARASRMRVPLVLLTVRRHRAACLLNVTAIYQSVFDLSAPLRTGVEDVLQSAFSVE